MAANQQLGGIPTLKYLDLRAFGPLIARGGPIRFFFLRRGIEFKEELITFPEWNSGVKAQMMESGDSPTGSLPVVHLNGKSYIEHHSILRTLSRRLNEYGTDVEIDYLVDRVADTTFAFKDALITSLLDASTKESYLEKRPRFYKLTDTLLSMASAEGACVVGSQPSFADELVFAVVSDDVTVNGSDELDKNANLKAFYDAYGAIEPVSQWKTAGWKGE